MTSSSVLSRLSKLQHFVEVAQQGSFRAAADKLNVAPSAVSKQIKNLEDHFGVELFRRDRGRGGLELTEAGSILLYRSASIINELSIVREELNELLGLKRGHLRVGVNEVVASDLLPGILHNMHRNFPALEYTIIVENTPEILKRLHDGDVDIGLGYNFAAAPEIEVLATLHRRTFLITSQNHALAPRRKVRLEEIAGEKFIFPDSSVALHQMLQDALIRSGVEVRTIMHTNSFSLLRQMVQDGLGVSMVIGRFLQSKREQLAFIEVENLGIERKPLSCCRVAGRAPTSSSVAFAASVKALFAQYGG
ncbi:LysR family transcriptional regulator [Jiella pacifica]|uniref:LysR family transcriptional regulator n=1 Tax=Jiella pacifica TaxID=2696469 RepID=A0A6N9T0Z5_9HYPH|nr:LysR family transcriptional regulator [Jiella pacifica]NDW05000.1 LysR family transcriptional regulator [Jiella pacifica]